MVNIFEFLLSNLFRRRYGASPESSENLGGLKLIFFRQKRATKVLIAFGFMALQKKLWAEELQRIARLEQSEQAKQIALKKNSEKNQNADETIITNLQFLEFHQHF